MREYFCAYHSMLGGTRKLSDAECGRLFRALLRYSAGEDVGLINLQGREEVLFDVYSQQIDRDVKAYEASIVRGRENGSKGGRPKKSSENPVVFLENPENPVVFKKTQKTQDKDKDEDKGKDKDNNLRERFNNHWRTASKARASQAQEVIDILREMECERVLYPQMHEHLIKAMEHGISPERLLEAARNSRNGSDLMCWIGLNGGVDDDES